ncbi:helix-turn-helix transcriptional regulator [Saccharothrix sp. S26]|uniref:winged helix-turn-helix transcriptional regulator n=1 Tax=Saccharothrix sp. S26 TaxID=2907215 RepID=UPI001F263F32|nr:helix-turn-helix domain-containing protein [Saccharothrix sp. S26]MCE6996846.1 helix-turn-helix transcriptional regulator [Saccharothrix sp. S26]
MTAPDEATCSLIKAVDLVGERWTFFVLREALAGTTRFSDFRARLGIASDVLTARLAKLVDSGLMTRRAYREPGQRPREGYCLTEAGRQFNVVLCALQQWGDEHLPDTTSTVVYRTVDGRPVQVRFVDGEGAVVAAGDVRPERGR